jgi:hypothetical protein
METSNQTKIADRIIDGLKKSIVEMEELRVQVALGKAEAKDLYEDARKKFKKILTEAENKLAAANDGAHNGAQKIRTLFESLQVQLALGKAETKDAFEEQKEKITRLLQDLENAIRSNETSNEYYTNMLMEMEKFKIKLEIIKLKYALKKMNARDEFEEKKKEFMSKFTELKERMLKKETGAEKKWDHFRGEITEAFGHLKNAFAH